MGRHFNSLTWLGLCSTVTIRVKEEDGVCWSFVLIWFEVYGLGPVFGLLLSSDCQCVLFIRRRDGRLWRRHGECWHGPNGVWIRYITHSLLTFPSPQPPLFPTTCNAICFYSFPYHPLKKKTPAILKRSSFQDERKRPCWLNEPL